LDLPLKENTKQTPEIIGEKEPPSGTDSGEERLNRSLENNHRDQQVVFRDLLLNSTPRSFVTNGLVLVNVIVYIIIAVSSGNFMAPHLADFIAWGAKYNHMMIATNEWWRLLSAFFIHANLLHLVLDMWFLWVLGNLAEKMFGNIAFSLVYLAGGLGGTIASFLASPGMVSVTASGPVFGIAGGLVAFLVVGNVGIPGVYVRRIFRDLVIFGIASIVLGLVSAGIDIAVNLGGLCAGFASGLVLKRPLPMGEDDHPGKRYALFFAAGVLVIAVTLVTGVAIGKKGEGALIPDVAAVEELLGLDKIDEALALIDKKPAILRELPDKEIVQGLMFRKKGDYDDAIKTFLEIIRKNPNAPLLRMYLSQAYIDKKSYTDAIDTLRELTREVPDNAIAYGNLAWVYYLTDDFSTCITLSNKALELDKSLSYVRYNIALCTLRLDDTVKAREYYRNIPVLMDDDSKRTRNDAIEDLKDLVRKNIKKNEAEAVLEDVFGLTQREIDQAEASA
jgi:rhomboid protease GluP